ncbi:sigma-70 family RNA polymerase sigma factor [Altericroceibacterium spongiae]|uniref:Sigma-70 family RNA polymerase sigma factor n=1 Tax=Altericroceibacterium spongiae TaxID=2320269 RepID=A0A420EAA7_9SPHN|nr:sigma-70 family RNA polymerase sigma factor [Altericroceibacterium spongiae]
MERSKDKAIGLYAAHRGELVNYATHILGDRARAEDVVQDAWLRYDRAVGRTAIREPLQYLYRVVRNVALDGRQRINLDNKRHAEDFDEIAATLASDRPTPEAEATARNELELVRTALSELPERTRIAVEMHRFGGHTLTEIARHLGVSVGTAHALVADGVKHCHRRREGGA